MVKKVKMRPDPNLRVDYLFAHANPLPSWASPLTNGRSFDGVFPGYRAVRAKEFSNHKVFHDFAPSNPTELMGFVHPKIKTVEFIDNFHPKNVEVEALQDLRWQKLPYDDLGRCHCA